MVSISLFLFFIAYLRWLPVNACFSFTDLEHPTVNGLYTFFRAIVLHLVSLFLLTATSHLLTMRSLMISTMGEDFVLTARAKGLSERRISTVHAAGNAIIPITARMSLEFAAIMSG